MEVRYDERVKNCTSEQELVEYLLACAPVIKEYTTESETKVGTQKALGFDVSVRKAHSAKTFIKNTFGTSKGSTKKKLLK